MGTVRSSFVILAGCLWLLACSSNNSNSGAAKLAAQSLNSSTPSGTETWPTVPAHFLYMPRFDSNSNPLPTDVVGLDASGNFLSYSTAQICNPKQFLMHPSRHFAFSICGSDIVTYAIDSTYGTPSVSSQVAPSFSINSTIEDPLGRFLYSIQKTGINWSIIEPSSGVVTPQAGTVAIPNGFCASGIRVQNTIDGKGHYLYIGCWGNATIAIYSLNATSGLPTYVGTYSVTTGCDVSAIMADGSGSYLLTACQMGTDGNSIGMLSIDQNTGMLGSPTPLTYLASYSASSGVPNPGPDSPDWFAADQIDGETIYSINFAGPSSILKINPAMGSFSYEGDIPVAAQGFWSGIARLPGLPNIGFTGNSSGVSVLSLDPLSESATLLNVQTVDSGTWGHDVVPIGVK